MLTGIGIIVSILYYSNVLRNSDQTRKTQLFMQFLHVLNSEDNQRIFAELMNMNIGDYDDFMKKYDHSVNEEHFAKRSSLWWNYNAVGYLLADNLIPVGLAYKLVGAPIILMWDKWGALILQVKEKQDLPNYFEGFEYAYRRLSKYSEEYPRLIP